ncbi:hypothetical protein [Frigidibacter sp.]|uniref:hypothetical protein n=1 Tax=Frigidibacter sp. TaxID=2586418 RepID=UPI0027345075|nr:hypothetical protein [Frigidibacter sp.]MDP3341885.1 hypothetical protein [Frigidibacter sp.]
MMIDGRFDQDFAEIFAASLANEGHGDMTGPAMAALFAAALGLAAVFSMLVLG